MKRIFSMTKANSLIIKSILSLTLSFIFYGAMSQGFPENPTQINEIPPSPTMWEFQKYGNYPVSMHTGVPNISIPMSAAQSGILQVPISLNYHASGIKVDQKATWVGLGWSLSAGGAITRTVRGSADESQGGYISHPYKNEGDFDPAFSNNYVRTEEMIIGIVDTEPDIFNYTFMNYSGKFIFNHSENKEDAIIALIPHNDLKITPIFTGATITSFIIVTPQGIEAEFAYHEILHEYRSGILSDFTASASNVWHLKKLTSPNQSDQITFEYDLVPGNNSNSAGGVHDPRFSHSESVNYEDPCNSFNYIISNNISEASVNYFGVKKLKKIIHRNGYIIFESSTGNRLDDPQDEGLRLDAVRFYSSLNGSNILIKSYELNYDYFGTIISSSPFPEKDQVRLKLNEIYSVGSEGGRKNPHQFFYNEPNYIPYGLPARFSNGQDYWGYYNGKTTNSSLAPAYNHQLINGIYTTLGDANREVNTARAKAGVLEKIVYPTLGYTTFEFESNTATVVEGGIPEQKLVGGLRVKNISSFEEGGTLRWQKYYEYIQKNDSTLSSGVYNGKNFIKPRDFFYASEYHFKNNEPKYKSCFNNTAFFYQSYITQNEGIRSSPAITNNFASVFYSTVKEYIGNPSINMGYKWYHYATTKDRFYQGRGPISFSIDRSWDRGQLELEETYENGNSIPVTTITSNYEKVIVKEPISGFKAGTRFSVEGIGYVEILPYPPTPASDYEYRSSRYFLTYYEEPVVWKRLKSTITFQDGLSTKEILFYNDDLKHTNLIGRNVKNSVGKEIETTIKYPLDYTSPSSITTEMINQHMIANPIEQIQTVDGEVLKAIGTKYHLKNSMLLPKETYILETNIPLTSFNESTDGSAFTDYKKRLTYHKYDNKGNILEYSKTNDIHTAIIWGYNQTYPVAKISNATYTQIESALGGTGFTVGIDGSEGLTNTQIDALKAITEVQVATYTYKPLVGILTQTDHQGFTTYYEYDEFKRLKSIKDKDGNIVKNFEYHYRNQ